jgi:hypothetical protein
MTNLTETEILATFESMRLSGLHVEIKAQPEPKINVPWEITISPFGKMAPKAAVSGESFYEVGNKALKAWEAVK